MCPPKLLFTKRGGGIVFAARGGNELLLGKLLLLLKFGLLVALLFEEKGVWLF